MCSRISGGNLEIKLVECSEKEVESGVEVQFFILDRKSSTIVSSEGLKAPSATKVPNLKRLSAIWCIICNKWPKE